MKKIINRMIKEKYFCGLDIGSQSIKVGILKVTDLDHFELVGAYEHKTYGFKDASVSDLGELTECIHNTIAELSNKTKVKIKEVQLGIGGELIDTRQTNTAIPLVDRGSKVIANRDLKKINNQARLLGAKMEEEILHHLPQVYQVDDVNSALNPLGLYGRKLSVQSLIVLSNETRIRNITKAVNQAGYDVANLFFSSYVSADTVLSDEEKSSGCILIDIGSKVTNVLCFKDNVLKFVDKIDLAGNDFTTSIANKFNLAFDLAEEIKKSYANALSSDVNEDDEILVRQESSYVPIKQQVIYESIAPVIEKLVHQIQLSIDESQLKSQINQGIVVVGGGALLPGLIECIGQATGGTVRLGKINIASEKNMSNVALLSPVIGLAQNGIKQSLRYAISSEAEVNWMNRVTNKVKELYHEYF